MEGPESFRFHLGVLRARIQRAAPRRRVMRLDN
jgi:hypothetical protein